MVIGRQLPLSKFVTAEYCLNKGKVYAIWFMRLASPSRRIEIELPLRDLYSILRIVKMDYKAPSARAAPTPTKKQWGRLSARIRRCPSKLMGSLKLLRGYFASFFRSVGLAIIPTTGGVEEPKVLLRQSWKTALARCGVHLLPSIVSLIVVNVNLMTVYIGTELVGPSGQDDIKLSVLQVCAKVQVIMDFTYSVYTHDLWC